MKILVFSALSVLVAAFLFVWLVSRIRYRIGSRHVKVILFGIPIRRVALANLEGVSKRRGPGLAEHWWSTLSPKHRLLVLRRRRGLFKNFVVTPRNRYIFKCDVERGIRRCGGVPSSTELPGESGPDLEKESELGQDDVKEMARVPAGPEPA
jgi:hypothetical protein